MAILGDQIGFCSVGLRAVTELSQSHYTYSVVNPVPYPRNLLEYGIEPHDILRKLKLKLELSTPNDQQLGTSLPHQF
jgi:hypothetical protein